MADRTPIEDIPVVILCGGMGTRLREETDKVPKPLVAIGEKPILWHIMKLYSAFGTRRFILCLGYKSWLIKEFFLRYREQVSDFTLEMSNDHKPTYHDASADEDWIVTCAETGLTTATGARLRRVQSYIDTETFMFTYGDGLGRVDIGALLDFHYEAGRVGTVTGVHPTSRYGEMRAEDGKVVEFNEKPETAEGFSSGGFFVFEREFFNYLNDDPQLFFEHAPLQELARDGQLSVFPHNDYWIGMDTYRELTELNELWASGKPPWKVWD
jgi:glucose-1-phosphate cytidylyltransferase